VSEKRARKTVCAALGLQREGSRIRTVLNDAIGHLPATVVRRDGFLYPRVYEASVRISGDDNSSHREMADIPPPEIALAAREILREDGLLPPDDLEREVVTLFRGQTTNVTSKAREPVSRAIESEISGGRIRVLSDGRLSLAQ
jgi:hypothetical protein